MIDEDVQEFVRENNLAVQPPQPPSIVIVDMVPRAHGASDSGVKSESAVSEKRIPAIDLPSRSSVQYASSYKPAASGLSLDIEIRHKKGGTRQRGCPCCDPDSLENIVDRLLLQNAPP